jgi:hypothetical protein
VRLLKQGILSREVNMRLKTALGASTKITGISSLGVGKTTIRFSSETEKKNPNSLRFVIGHIINFYCGGTREAAVVFFRKTDGRYKSDRTATSTKTVNLKAISELLDDETYATYWHLEAIARSLRFPVGALLSLTRVYSLIRDGKTEAVDTFISGLRTFADRLESLAVKKSISKEDFDEMIACFARTYEAESPSLFDRQE